MRELDAALHQLCEEPVPPQLASLDARVLARVEDHSFAKEPLRTSVAAIGLALLIGVAGGMLPDAEPGPKRVSPDLSEATKLAPSTLLLGTP